jgi:hypothetical protein
VFEVDVLVFEVDVLVFEVDVLVFEVDVLVFEVDVLVFIEDVCSWARAEVLEAPSPKTTAKARTRQSRGTPQLITGFCFILLVSSRRAAKRGYHEWLTIVNKKTPVV